MHTLLALLAVLSVSPAPVKTKAPQGMNPFDLKQLEVKPEFKNGNGHKRSKHAGRDTHTTRQ